MTSPTLDCPENMRILFVRHGETESNVEDRYMGHLDSPLSTRGVEQAKAVAARLAGEGIDALVTSDLGRALSTARHIADACHLEMILDPRLRERHAGEFQGLLAEEARARYPDYFIESADPTPETSIPGGESAVQIQERVVPLLEEVCPQYAGRTVALVTHGIVIRTMFWRLLECSYAAAFRARVDNAGLTVFRAKNGRWALQSWNDTEHLSRSSNSE
jgi:broad specificity phosphatase PhoE